MPSKRKSKQRTTSEPAKGAQPGNSNAKKTGFYSDQFTVEELALVALFQDPTLDDELWLQRVLNRRLVQFAAGDIPLETLVKVVEALSIGTGRVARLLRDRRALSGEAAEGLTGALATALDELSTELGIAL